MGLESPKLLARKYGMRHNKTFVLTLYIAAREFRRWPPRPSTASGLQHMSDLHMLTRSGMRSSAGKAMICDYGDSTS